MTLFYAYREGQNNRRDNIDYDDNKGCSYDCRLLKTVVEEPVFAIWGGVVRWLRSCLVHYLKLFKSYSAYFNASGYQLLEAVAMHEANPIRTIFLLIYPGNFFEFVSSRVSWASHIDIVLSLKP